MSRLVSSKVKKTPPPQVSEDRYDFLQLSEAEPDLGVPPDEGYTITSDVDGVRSWVEINNRSVMGFKYNFIGYSEGEEDPGLGNISSFFGGSDSYFNISKVTFDNQNISYVFPYMTRSTSIQKSIVFLKNLEKDALSQVFFALATGSQEFSDHYRIDFTASDGDLFNPDSLVSFEFFISGDKGSAVTILGIYTDLDAIEAAHPTGNAGDAYLVDNGNLYVWNPNISEWINVGPVRGPQGPPGPSQPLIDGGTASTLF